MKPVIPYLNINNAIEAISFYKEVFNAKIVGEILYLSDVDGFEEYGKLVGHAELSINSTSLFICDNIDQEIISGNQIHFVIECSTIKELKKRFELLKLEGTVLHDLKELFWCELCGYVRDKFGIKWDLYYRLK